MHLLQLQTSTGNQATICSGFYVYFQVIEAASNLKQQVMEKLNRDSWGEQEFEIIRQLKLRYFTPQEVANLMCFPKSFSKLEI